MSVRDLSSKAEVGISTINRVVNALGYKDFNTLKQTYMNIIPYQLLDLHLPKSHL